MISINGRNVSSEKNTGVQRYTREILRHSDLKGCKVIYSPPWLSSGTPGYLWEQFVLPIRAKGTLWSPANLGPIFYRNQILTVHDVSPFDHPEWFSREYVRMQKIILPVLLRRVKHIITVSEYSKSRIIENFQIEGKKISVIPLGVDQKFKPFTEEEKSEARKAIGLPEDYILTLSSIEPRKNISSLLRAWELWEERPTQLKLVVAGTSSKIFSDANLGRVPRDVKFIGQVDEKNLVALYASAKVFIYPSLYEGFGLPPLEAMACGVPVITSNCTSLPEVVGNAALLIDPHDIRSILSGIKKIYFDEDLENCLRLEGLRRSREFNWATTAQMTLDILETYAGK